MPVGRDAGQQSWPLEVMVHKMWKMFVFSLICPLVLWFWNKGRLTGNKKINFRAGLSSPSSIMAGQVTQEICDSPGTWVRVYAGDTS